MFLTFWVANVLRATAACHFSTAERQKVVPEWCVFNILTCKCASRYSGVPFFDVWTSKSAPNMVCFVRVELQMCFAPQRRAIFWHLNFQNNCLLWAATSAPAASASLLVGPADTQIIGKTQRFATFLTVRAIVSAFFWLSRDCIFFLFFLLTLLLLSAFHLLALLLCSAFQLSILSEVSLLNFLWWFQWKDMPWFKIVYLCHDLR